MQRLAFLLKILFTYIAIGLIPFCSINATANETAPDAWNFIVAPYFWPFGINGDITVQGQRIHLDTQPKDTLDILSDLDFAAQIHAEANKKDWTLLLDGTYLKLTQEVNLPGPTDARVTPEIGLVDFGLYYNIAHIEQPLYFPSPVQLQLLGAGRYFFLQTTLSPDGLPTLKQHQNFVTPILGIRMMSSLNNHINIMLSGDYGGFGIDSVRNTWSSKATLEYLINKTIGIALSYRVMGIHFDRGSGDNAFKFNARMFGPALGVTFRF